MGSETGIKVYELAKQLGMDSLSLVDKLKSLNIHVKNHMSELDSGAIQVAKEAILGSAKTAGKTAAKATTKTSTKTGSKTVTRAKAAASPAAAPAEAEKKPATTVRARKKVTEEATAKAASTTDSEDKKSASPVIRRRSKLEGGTEVVQSTIIGGNEKQYEGRSEGTHEEGELSEGADLAQAEFSGTESEESSAEWAGQTEAVETTEAGSPAEATEDLQASTEKRADTSTEAPVKKLSIAPARPQAPKRNILTIVDLPPPPKITPAVKPVAGAKGVVAKPGDKDNFRIIKMTKENLDQMVEEEAAKKKAGGAREQTLNPEDVRFADYRKKEMVFLPKKKKLPVGKEIKRTQITVAASHKRVVEFNESITVAELAHQMGVKSGDVIKSLMKMGQMATINQALDYDTTCLVATEFNHEVKNVAFNEDVLLKPAETAEEETVEARPPVITIMGHVDHGKTSLLDAIREANVAGGEFGGITQHIGAYTVEKNGKWITFIDTPGHEAFTLMRARGANVTDIVVLVVAADDGVMPQTREAISHARAANVPIIVAVNKIDKPQANPERVKQALAELNLLAEDWGGETQFVGVSALQKTNLDKLLEAILLQAEILDLKANASTDASGVILESRLEKGRGPAVSVLVRRGTLNVGDPILCGTSIGRVKALVDDRGRAVQKATPGYAVEVLGFETVPNAGDPFICLKEEGDLRKIQEHRIEKQRAKAAPTVKMSLESFFNKVQTGETKELAIILKADVFGSVEAIRDSLTKVNTEKVKTKVILAAAGGITESDVLLATASNAIILGFNVRPETKARQVAESEHVEIKCYNIIYELIEDVKKAMAGLLDKKKVERFLGRAEVRQTFSIPKSGTIAGSSVIDGKILRASNVRLLRDSRVIFEGKLSSLRRFKDDAKEVAQGYECGIGIEGYNDLKPGDIIESYQIDLITPELHE